MFSWAQADSLLNRPALFGSLARNPATERLSNGSGPPGGEGLENRVASHMSYLNAYSAGRSNRYSGKSVVVPVNFLCIAPAAKAVSVIGDFNNWEGGVHAMQKGPDGSWRLQIQLNHGHHRYLFQVDDTTMLDPRAQGVARNEQNERVSLVAVS